MKIQWNLDITITNLCTTKKFSEKRTIFFTLIIEKYMEKNFDIKKPCQSEQILPAP